MSGSLRTDAKRQASAQPLSAPTRGNFLRRKCACGKHTAGGEECGACNKARTLQRRPARSNVDAGAHEEVPQVVHDVLRSPGRALDEGARAFMEPRFGRDFSGVRVHTDTTAAESADAVGALAYTVGRDIVFAGGLYAPHTSEGRGLLAHELTHVAQNSAATTDASAPIRVGPEGDRFEAEADKRAGDVASGAPARGAIAPNGEPGRLSRATTIQFGTTSVNVDYANVSGVDAAKYESEIESNFTAWTGSPASTIHADLTKLGNDAKEWVLYALDLLVDNPVAGLDKVAAVRSLIQYAPTARFKSYGKPAADFEKEALSVSGWFEKGLTSNLSAPNKTRLNYVQGKLGQASGGSACPARTQPGTQFDSQTLENDLPKELLTYLGKVVVPSSVKTQAMSPLLTIADEIQKQARIYFAPYADKGRGGGNTVTQQWQYSAHAVSGQTQAGTPPADLTLAYLDSRARIVGEKGLFAKTNYDRRCPGDEAVLEGIVKKMEPQANVRALTDPILRQKSYTEESATPKKVVINTQYDAQLDECDARWETIKTMCHELMHVMAHDDFRAAIKGRTVLREGFPEVLGHQLYQNIAGQSGLKASMEKGLKSAPCSYVPPSTIGYAPHGDNADKIRIAVTNDNFRAAFFLGQLNLAGIQPKLAVGEASGDPHEAEADAASRAVAESRTFTPSLRRAPSAFDFGPVNAGPGRPLEPSVRSEMESKLGHDFSGVRVHADARAAESARGVRALAYTLGRDIVFGPGQYTPETSAGRRLLAHELTHVVQQSAAEPFTAPGEAHEAEADGVAESVVRGSAVPAVRRGAGRAIQRTVEMRDVGAGEASGFGRRQELVARLNGVSQGLNFSLDGANHLVFEQRAGRTLSDFDRQMMKFIRDNRVIPLRLTNRRGRDVNVAVEGDTWASGYVDIDDLLASTSEGLRLVFLHILRERFETRNYARRIGSSSLNASLPGPAREFNVVHRRGINSEAAMLRDLFGDHSIQFVREPLAGEVFRIYRNKRGDEIHARERRGSGERAGEDAISVEVVTSDGVTRTVQEYRRILDAERAAGGAAGAGGAGAGAGAAAAPAAPVPAAPAR